MAITKTNVQSKIAVPSVDGNIPLATDFVKGDIVLNTDRQTTSTIDDNGDLVIVGEVNRNTDSAYGYSKRVAKSDIWLETDTPNVIVDKASSSIRLSDGLYEVEANTDVTLPLAPFAQTSTDELLDHSVNGVTTQVDHTAGDIVMCGNNSANFTEQAYTTIAPSIASDLLTDVTKFKPIPYVTRQDVILSTKTGYKTIKGFEVFSKKEAYADKIAERYGYTKLGNGLYHDGTEEVVIVGLVPRLNAGAYHPVYNSFGTTNYIQQGTGRFNWYNFSLSIASMYYTMALTGNTHGAYIAGGRIGSTENGRPDGKFYDKIYYEGAGGLIFLPIYSKSRSRTDILIDGSNNLVTGDFDLVLEEGVEVITMPIVPFKSKAEYLADGTLAYSPYLLTQCKALTVDIVGSPTNYSQDWLDYLALGKALPFNPLLIGENGEDYTNITNVFITRKFSNKALDILNVQTNENAGSGWYSMSISNDGSPSSIQYEALNAVTNVSITNLADSLPNPEKTLYVFNYESLNTPLIQADLLPILQVLPKVLASNSHSWSKGGGVVSALGKIPVGNGANSLENKYLNGEIDTDYTHLPIALDSSVSPTAKWFVTLARDTNKEYLVQVIGKELIFNTDYGDNDKFDQLTNSTDTNLNGDTVKTYTRYFRTGEFDD